MFFEIVILLGQPIILPRIEEVVISQVRSTQVVVGLITFELGWSVDFIDNFILLRSISLFLTNFFLDL